VTAPVPLRFLSQEANSGLQTDAFLIVASPRSVGEPVKAEAAAGGGRQARLCAGHAQQLGGESPLCNLMEVKHG
jgi:hypothetical protein